MVPYDRFTVVLDACVLFPMLVRDVLLTFADNEFFNPKWSPRIHGEWTRNLLARLTKTQPAGEVQTRIERLQKAIDRAFPDALVTVSLPETEAVAAVDPKDRPVVMTAVAARADAIYRHVQHSGFRARPFARTLTNWRGPS
jgi:hypothetical protein